MIAVFYFTRRRRQVGNSARRLASSCRQGLSHNKQQDDRRRYYDTEGTGDRICLNMTCAKCAAANPDGQHYCGNCGHRLATETVGSLVERLARVEQQIAASRTNVPQQTLELEVATSVMERVRRWTSLFLYPATILLTIFGLILALVFGKGVLDIRSIAANAQTAVQQIVERARVEATNAETTAHSALETSTQVNANIKATQQSVSSLKSQVDARLADADKLGAQLETSRKQLDDLTSKMNAQQAQFARMTEQTKTLQTAKGIEDVQTIYPIFGTHVARTTEGYIDPKKKPSDALYVALNLSLTHTLNINDRQAGAAVAALRDHNFTVTVGPVYMEARTANSTQNVGMGLDSYSCNSWVKPASKPPCILYFRASLKNSAMDIRNLVKVAQNVPDDRIFYLDPTKLNADQQELLKLSAWDFLVVLGDSGE